MVVPTVSSKTNGYSAVWVGIGRLQFLHGGALGTGEDVVNGKVSLLCLVRDVPICLCDHPRRFR